MVEVEDVGKGGVMGLPDAPLGEVFELGIVGVLSILTPLSFMVMIGKKMLNGRKREQWDPKLSFSLVEISFFFLRFFGGVMERSEATRKAGSSAGQAAKWSWATVVGRKAERLATAGERG